MTADPLADDITQAAACLGSDGLLAGEVQGFAARPQQQQMAAAVEQALVDASALIVEAGTGTGKTFAYLVPALLSGKKVIISTGTRHLQDQLFHRDLPTVRSALGVPLKAALLKGRANYLCHQRLHMTRSEGRLSDRRQVNQLEQVFEWSGRTASGDIAELSNIPEDAFIWPKVTSTTENCLGSDCDWFSDCHVMKARREAQNADLVVINHHLLCADMALKEEGFGELLPGAEAFIIDEAHQLPETASRFFGMALSSRQLLELAQDSINEYVDETGKLDGLPDVAHELEKATREFRLVMGQGEQRSPWSRLAGNEALTEGRDALKTALAELALQLEALSERSRGLDNCYQRTLRVQALLAQTTEQPPAGYIHWFETWRQSFRINLTPLDVSGNHFALTSRRSMCRRISTASVTHYRTAGSLPRQPCQSMTALVTLPANWGWKMPIPCNSTARLTMPTMRCSMCPRVCQNPLMRISPTACSMRQKLLSTRHMAVLLCFLPVTVP